MHLIPNIPNMKKETRTNEEGHEYLNGVRADAHADPHRMTEGESVGTGTGVAMIGDATYETLADAVAVGGDIKLLKDTAEDITILAGKTITIDLNGKKITNKSADTITVEKGAALTINGTGTVDNVTHGKAAIVNGGTVVLNGGLYTRSKEDMENNKDTGGKNSYYTILNDNGGVMTINAGVEVKNIGHFSSMIRNGGTTASTLTINGGTFSGGINTVKNDGAGTLTINGGDFSNTTQFVVMNWHKATIIRSMVVPSKLSLRQRPCCLPLRMEKMQKCWVN